MRDYLVLSTSRGVVVLEEGNGSLRCQPRGQAGAHSRSSRRLLMPCHRLGQDDREIIAGLCMVTSQKETSGGSLTRKSRCTSTPCEACMNVSTSKQGRSHSASWNLRRARCYFRQFGPRHAFSDWRRPDSNLAGRIPHEEEFAIDSELLRLRDVYSTRVERVLTPAEEVDKRKLEAES